MASQVTQRPILAMGILAKQGFDLRVSSVGASLRRSSTLLPRVPFGNLYYLPPTFEETPPAALLSLRSQGESSTKPKGEAEKLKDERKVKKKQKSDQQAKPSKVAPQPPHRLPAPTVIIACLGRPDEPEETERGKMVGEAGEEGAEAGEAGDAVRSVEPRLGVLQSQKDMVAKLW